MLQRGQTPKTLNYTKEARHKRPHILSSFYVKFPEELNLFKKIECTFIVTRGLGEKDGIGNTYLVGRDFFFFSEWILLKNSQGHLAGSVVEHMTPDLKIVGSSPTMDVEITKNKIF